MIQNSIISYSHVWIDVFDDIEVYDVIRRICIVDLNTKINACKYVHAQGCNHQQSANFEYGRSKVYHGVIFNNPVNGRYLQLQ